MEISVHNTLWRLNRRAPGLPKGTSEYRQILYTVRLFDWFIDRLMDLGNKGNQRCLSDTPLGHRPREFSS